MSGQCMTRVYGSVHQFGGSKCSLPAKEGKPYCAIHSPEAKLKRRQKADAKYYAERDRINARADALKEQRRKAECYPDLLEALIGVVKVADRETVEFHAARAAIAKATGQ